MSRRGRRLAIQKLVSTLDSDEMDMVIEAIDTKIDDVAVQHEAEESRHHTLESESLEDQRTKKMIQEDPRIMEQPLTVKPKPEEPKPEVDQDPLQCSCSHCSILADLIANMTRAELKKLEKKQCWNCHATENLLKCAGCRRARYCSVECQTADRERHGEWCERKERLRVFQPKLEISRD